jgi:hypothetical protein
MKKTEIEIIVSDSLYWLSDAPPPFPLNPRWLNTNRTTLVFFLPGTRPLQSYGLASPHPRYMVAYREMTGRSQILPCWLGWRRVKTTVIQMPLCPHLSQIFFTFLASLLVSLLAYGKGGMQPVLTNRNWAWVPFLYSFSIEERHCVRHRIFSQ